MLLITYQNYIQKKIYLISCKLIFGNQKPRDQAKLPLFLYEDDFECGNPLGSHATLYKMSGISLPCLPPELRSKLDTIFLVQIAHSSDVQEYRDEFVYGHVIKQLNSLAIEGIKININGKLITILFKLALIA